jgi:hypothetical protein
VALQVFCVRAQRLFVALSPTQLQLLQISFPSFSNLNRIPFGTWARDGASTHSPHLPHAKGHMAETPVNLQRLIVAFAATQTQDLATEFPSFFTLNLKGESLQPGEATGAEVTAATGAAVTGTTGAAVTGTTGAAVTGTTGAEVIPATGVAEGLIDSVGLLVGPSLGTTLGIKLGLLLGDLLGTSLGTALGFKLGLSLGNLLG